LRRFCAGLPRPVHAPGQDDEQAEKRGETDCSEKCFHMSLSLLMKIAFAQNVACAEGVLASLYKSS
jgi:hypothetical protein